MDLKLLKEMMESSGVVFGPGLNDEEISLAEQKYDFKFPPDLKLWLQYALPNKTNGEHHMWFPNWRDLEDKDLKDQITAPLQGILFDVEHNDFWLEELGARPASLEEAKMIMAKAVDTAPKLIPLYGHRFLPSEPLEEGNPILSVHQTDIIYYGSNLQRYLEIEFRSPGKTVIYPGDVEEPKKIRFWSQIIEGG